MKQASKQTGRQAGKQARMQASTWSAFSRSQALEGLVMYFNLIDFELDRV